MVGNGATDFNYDVNPAFPRTLYNFNIITLEQIEAYEKNNCHFYFRDVMPHSTSAECIKANNDISDMASKLNWYDLYRKVYPASSLLQAKPRLGSTVVEGKEMTYKRGMTMQEYTPWLKHRVGGS